jgi:hypothetical protein
VMNEDTKKKVVEVLAVVVGILFGPIIVCWFLLSDYYFCPNCSTVLKRGVPACSHCGVLLSWRGDSDY